MIWVFTVISVFLYLVAAFFAVAVGCAHQDGNMRAKRAVGVLFCILFAMAAGLQVSTLLGAS